MAVLIQKNSFAITAYEKNYEFVNYNKLNHLAYCSGYLGPIIFIIDYALLEYEVNYIALNNYEKKEIKYLYENILEASQLIENEIKIIEINQCEFHSNICSNIHDKSFNLGLDDGFDLFDNIFKRYNNGFEISKELEKNDEKIFRCFNEIDMN